MPTYSVTGTCTLFLVQQGTTCYIKTKKLLHCYVQQTYTFHNNNQQLLGYSVDGSCRSRTRLVLCCVTQLCTVIIYAHLCDQFLHQLFQVQVFVSAFCVLIEPFYLCYGQLFCAWCIYSVLLFDCQYPCNQLPGRTRLQNELLCVEWDVQPLGLTSASSLFQIALSRVQPQLIKLTHATCTNNNKNNNQTTFTDK